jgi:transposase
MTKHRSHSVAFKRQVAQEFVAGETLHGLSKRHDISRQLIRIWVGKYEAGALDDDVQAADLLQEYEAKIAALERMVGRQALEIEFLKGGLKNAPRPRSERGADGKWGVSQAEPAGTAGSSRKTSGRGTWPGRRSDARRSDGGKLTPTDTLLRGARAGSPKRDPLAGSRQKRVARRRANSAERPP